MTKKNTAFAFFLSFAAFLMSALAQADNAYKAAMPDSRLVRSLMDTPIPHNLNEIAHIPETLQRLFFGTESKLLNAYFERSFLLGLAEQPLPKVETVGAAIEQERQQAKSLDDVRHGVLASLLSVRLANSDDTLPQGVRNRPESYQSMGDGIWQPVPINEKAVVHYLHVVTHNQGKAELRMVLAELRVRAQPGDKPVTLWCNRYAEFEPVLAVGTSVSMFCATDGQEKQPLAQLVNVARRLAAGGGSLEFEIQSVIFWENKLQLQRGQPGFKRFSARYLRSNSVSSFPESRRSAKEIVEDSACWDRGTCLREAVSFLGIDGGRNIGRPIGFAVGLLCYAILARARKGVASIKALVTTSVIVSLLWILPIFVGAFDTIMVFVLILNLGAPIWVAFLLALWGSWAIHRIRIAFVSRDGS